MIDIQFLREQPDKVEKASLNKGVAVNVSHILDTDEKVRELSHLVQQLRQDRNKAAKERNIEEGKRIKDELDQKEFALTTLQQELQAMLLGIPNPAKPDVKISPNEEDNEVIKTVGAPEKFNFAPKDHLEIGQILDIIDTQRAAKVSGTRFAYLKNEGVLLEFALVQFALETLMQEGFTPIIPPTLIKKETMAGLGYMENGGEEDMFHIEKDGIVLVGTAEHSIVPMHMDETFATNELPKRYVGFSSAFRREAGSYGKDTRGILRVHQFDKVEMVSYVKEGEDDKEHELLLSLEEKLFQKLKIPYQVVKMVTGDLGFPAARKYDIEAWIPAQNKYREVTSASTITDFQSRRLNIKYQEGNEKKYVNVLNGTAFAIGRTIIAILENYQQEDGSVVVPEVLRKNVGKDKLSAKETSKKDLL